MALQIHNAKGETVFDPYKSMQRWERKKSEILETFPSSDKNLVLQYVLDMEGGLNTKGRKGSRGYLHLNTCVSRLTKVAELIKTEFSKDRLTDLTQQEAHTLFNKMRKGLIRKADGSVYQSTHDYVKVLKAFWNWYQRVQRKEGITVQDVVEDLDGRADRKPDFVYFTLESLTRMAEQAKYEYKVLMYFLFDAGIRAPTELMNLKRKDFTWLDREHIFELDIRNETSKTFGRKIKLLLSSDLLREFFKLKEIGKEEFVFRTSPHKMNQYLKRLSQKVFGLGLEGLSENKNGKRLTLYDFRHSSCCYWLPRYKSESALKYRFGWKKSDMIYYYTELLGMTDTITKEDMLINTT